MRRLLIALAVLGLIASSLAGTAYGHPEREVIQPEGDAFPDYRHTGPSVVVCKPDSARRIATLPASLRTRNEALLADCEFEHIQRAVNAVEADGQPGTRIFVLPGVYREEPSVNSHENRNGAPLGRDDLVDDCAQVLEDTNDGESFLTYEQHVTCPHIQNLIAVHGDTTPGDDSVGCDGNLCDLQIEGTGARPEDVIIDGNFGLWNGFHGDRAKGLYLKNMTAQHFEFNGFYILETASSTFDDTVGRYNHEYGFLTFEAFTLYENCRGNANGDSAFYPGASPNILEGTGLIPLHRDEAEFSTELRGCRGHHNALGFSGTTGNSVFAHHNEFDHNATGFATDSLFPDHPGTPQNHALLEDNIFHENNTNYYDMTAHEGVCSQPMNERDYEDGAVCPAIPLPVGTGRITAGGNFNWFHRNLAFDNWRTGTYQFWVPAEVREQGPDEDAHFRPGCGPDGGQQCPFEETSHWNTYSANRFAEQVPFGLVQPNGVDFTWDGEGQGNCWDQSGDDANTSAAGDVTYRIYDVDNGPNVAPSFPDCNDSRGTTYSIASSIVAETTCVAYDSSSQPDPPGCDWFRTPPVPSGRTPENPTLERLDGSDRVETAILASQEGYPTSAPTVVLARQDLYPDALAGAPLAHARGGPLLLTRGSRLDDRVKAEIQRLGPRTVILLGGPNALSPQVRSDLLTMGFSEDDVVRIAGKTRYGTAAEIARNLPATDALLAKGEGGSGWVDALSASAAGALLERPILLTAPNRVPDELKSLLEEGDIEAIDIIGGPGAVSESVEEQVAGHVNETERVAGEGRLDTSLEVAKFALKAGADPTELWLTTAGNWPDGIAAGSAVAVDEGIMLLVPSHISDTPVETWLNGTNPTHDTESATTVADILERVRILGGPNAVAPEVATELQDTYGATPGDARGDRSTGNQLTLGAFEPLPDAPAAYDDVRGYATLEKRLDGATRARAYVEGLPTSEGTAHPVHVHSEPCSFRPVADNPHYAQDPDGPVAEPNEIWPAFATGPGGTGLGDTTVFHVPEDDSLSVMIHTPANAGADKVLCADLK